MWIDDQILERCSEDLALNCFVPARPVVVLGSSNLGSTEADPAACAKDGVEILRRYGGGGTVVLHDGCVVVSLGCWVRQHFQNGFYFSLLNNAVIDVFTGQWPALAGLGQNGLSDITYGDRKVAGTSLFRSRNYLLYQASLLIDPRLALIERYLQHPSKEPTYRAGRSHRSFLVGLAEIVPNLEAKACADLLTQRLPAAMAQLFADELIATQPEQHPGLLKRARPT